MGNKLRGKIKQTNKLVGRPKNIELTGKLNVGTEKIYPTATLDINKNGTFDVLDYGTVNVQLTKDDVIDKIITFVDYDGTLLYEIKLDELDEMPPLPEHEGLICEGWNWTLEQLKEENASLYVGPAYVTDDGSTRIYIALGENDLDLWVSFQQPSNRTTFVDFGDGSEIYTSDTSGFVSINHIYPSPGDYVISLYSEGTSTNAIKLYGYTGKPGVLLCRRKVPAYNDSTIKDTETLMPAIQKVELGTYISTANGAFSYATNMKTITNRANTNTLGNGANFYNTPSLKTLVWTTQTVSQQGIGQNTFINSGLETLVTSPGFNGYRHYWSNDTTVFGNALKQCYIPKAVTDLPDFSNTRVVINRLPEKLYNLNETKAEDNFENTPTSLVSMVGNAMRGYRNPKFIVPSTVYSHWGYIFRDNKYIEEVIYPDDVKIVSNWFQFSSTFRDCNNLKKAILPNNIQTLDTYVFKGCYSLTTVRLPSQLTKIGSYTFQGCKSLKEIDIPDGVVEVGTNCFDGCTSLAGIKLPNNLQTVRSYAFTKQNIIGDIPTSVTIIESYAFSGCTTLTGPLDLSNVTGHNSYAFSGCTNLKEVKLSKTATSVGTGSFGNCPKLSYVYFPPNILTINSSAFQYATSGMVTDDYVDQLFDFRDHAAIPTVTTSSFTKQSKLKIVVPDDLYDTWITTGNWTGYASYIIKASDYTE